MSGSHDMPEKLHMPGGACFRIAQCLVTRGCTAEIHSRYDAGLHIAATGTEARSADQLIGSYIWPHQCPGRVSPNRCDRVCVSPPAVDAPGQIVATEGRGSYAQQ